ncbi:FkbM family methyltransferase [Nisaea sp.]|uniref:FkbM family methyltransferase n=1 Tax=Nisaea sp. TaxID=2024842 RepID=UPI0032F07AD8
MTKPEIKANEDEVLFSHFFDAAEDLVPTLVPGTPAYRFAHLAMSGAARRLFSTEKAERRAFGPFEDFFFPYFSMGSVDSVNLFALDELILFHIYRTYLGCRQKVLDLGANLGLHSIVLGRLGHEVRSFEPDPIHFELLRHNLGANAVSGQVTPINAAVGLEDGEAMFVRVKGNTTGSHLAGMKLNPYGELDEFGVTVKRFQPLLDWADFVKMDIEGAEADVIETTDPSSWVSKQAVMEVGSEASAQRIFNFFQDVKVNLFAQKIGWRKVSSLKDMPFSHRDGSLFVSKEDRLPFML